MIKNGFTLFFIALNSWTNPQHEFIYDFMITNIYIYIYIYNIYIYIHVMNDGIMICFLPLCYLHR